MVAANKFHLFDRYEYDVSDLRMYWHATPKTTGLIDIAAIDDKSIAELGQWPWPRSMMAQFERALIDYKVAVVGYDVLFSEQDNFDAARASLVDRLKKTGATQITADQLIGLANDQDFADAIKTQGKTILAYSFGTLDAAGHSKGLIEQGFTSDIEPPAAGVQPRVGRASSCAKAIWIPMVSASHPDSKSSGAQHRLRPDRFRCRWSNARANHGREIP